MSAGPRWGSWCEQEVDEQNRWRERRSTPLYTPQLTELIDKLRAYQALLIGSELRSRYRCLMIFLRTTKTSPTTSTSLASLIFVSGLCASPALSTFPCISRQHVPRTRIRHSNHLPLVQARCRSPASARGWKDRSLRSALEQDWDVSFEYVRYLLVVAESISYPSCIYCS